MPATHRRTATKLLRLHPEELADITARAEPGGLKPARFIIGVNCAAAGGLHAPTRSETDFRRTQSALSRSHRPTMPVRAR
jgi:hypothetical protein